MDRAPHVHFIYGQGSRYSYLAATQIGRLEADTGCRVIWRPLCSPDLLAARGLDPFVGAPVSRQYQGDYRRLDAERWAAYYGVPYVEPVDLVLDPHQLALAATAAARLGAVEPYGRRLFAAVFAEGRSALARAALVELAAAVDLDAGAFGELLDDPATGEALEETLGEALAMGVFGVPTLGLNDQVFWGNDRLPLLRHALRR